MILDHLIESRVGGEGQLLGGAGADGAVLLSERERERSERSERVLESSGEDNDAGDSFSPSAHTRRCASIFLRRPYTSCRYSASET